ncbi:glycoside hydrolase family 140 protein [Thermoflavifilum thermophilum]|uniref:Putative collagen-binding domain of a collagenase n=1 Tax=Thermoflavifilum thermophilum TaxID=1393122 RepID=A0A1I7MX62_9BACT|nr:glycoside hydrolase family 140 protein [Thermoflavifilum thermophilum]SFV27007.1 Putative collagen-binding domain of a collagenase [Thermoflavifilum thermophilum]
MINIKAGILLFFVFFHCILVDSVTYSQSIVKAQRLHVSDNHRYLVYADGTPFFWLGDTAWELFHRLNRDSCLLYLDNRAQKGFTVIQAVILAELDGLHMPNAEGHVPFLHDDPTQPNEAYFQDVDWVIQQAAKRGLYMAILPTWGDKIYKDQWGIGPEIFNPQNAYAYGYFLGKRYRNQWNIIWILGGDRNPRNEREMSIWRAMARGIEDGVGNADSCLMSYHPQPNDAGGSAAWFHKDAWLDFNMLQTGHCKDDPVYQQVMYDYQLTPVKPVLDGESLYEDHPICFQPDKYGFSTAVDVRKKFYWDLFSGSFGITYGCHDIWQFYSPAHEGINHPQRYWYEALDLPGSFQAALVKKLMLSRPFLTRIPAQDVLVSDSYSGADHIVATRDTNGSYLMVYSPTGRGFTIKLSAIKGKHIRCWWYNPRNGEANEISHIRKKEQMVFTPPTSGYGQDWILVVDDAKAHFPKPGEGTRYQ